MSTKFEEERLREIERAQVALRASIDDARRLSEWTERLLEKRRRRPDDEDR
jgi:hypothetical protein